MGVCFLEFKLTAVICFNLSTHLSILRPALEALFRIAVRAIWEGGNSSPASVMAACVKKSSEFFLRVSGFSSVGYLVWRMKCMRQMIEWNLRGTRLAQLQLQAHWPWGQWGSPPWVCRGCGPPGGNWVAGLAAAHTPESAPEPFPVLLEFPAEGCPQTVCWTHWTHRLYRTGMHMSAWNEKVSFKEVFID